jgi:L-alanine-DL-glutamate epimerase-like enolase superfamily enzyme
MSAPVPTYDLVASLPLSIDSYELEGFDVSYGLFDRLTTVIRLHGEGEEGAGEDVTYGGLDQIALRDAGPSLPLAGEHTIDSFSKLLETLELFPAPPERTGMESYRTWAFESAALDLALRQAGKPLHEVLGREPSPLNFVSSTRLTGEPPTTEAVRKRLAIAPNLRFKLDPENNWTPELIAELAELDCVATCDLKGLYRGTPVDVETDPELYRMCAESFPDAWLEDPDLSVPEADAVLEPHRGRITWDANIHSVQDIEGLPFAPRTINIKPSRFGSIKRLFDTYDYCAEQGIAMYGGGQSELSIGRGQIQYLASIFHPDTPNDVAPSGYNLSDPPSDLPAPPLEPAPRASGFSWE